MESIFSLGSHGPDDEADPMFAAAARPADYVRPPLEATCADASLLAIVEAPLAPGETATTGFRRKEHELGAAFAALSVPEARALHRRLSNPSPDDALAQRFARLTLERRGRLLAFLADARRRAAMKGGR